MGRNGIAVLEYRKGRNPFSTGDGDYGDFS